MTSKRIRRPSLQIDAEARAHRAVAAAERAAERERRTPDALAIADRQAALAALEAGADGDAAAFALGAGGVDRHVEHRRSEEHTSELQSLMRISYAVFCLKKKKQTKKVIAKQTTT